MVTMQVRSADSKLAAMREANSQGHADVALMILTGAVRVYTRSPKSRPGWQIADWDRPFPADTAGIVFLDTYDGEPRFYITTISEAQNIVGAQVHSGRPENPESRHCYIPPELLADYENQWVFYLRA
jgi:hypothetical protein